MCCACQSDTRNGGDAFETMSANDMGGPETGAGSDNATVSGGDATSADDAASVSDAASADDAASVSDAASADDATTSVGETASADAGDDAAGTEGTKYDITTGTSAEGDDEGSTSEGCAKVDFLFVIDNSASMEPFQTKLSAHYGPFIDTISSTLTTNDFHIMVLDSDACGEFEFFTNPGVHPYDPTIDNQCAADFGCEGTVGAGQVRDCGVPGGVRYLTSQLDDATLKSSFQCLAAVGDGGSFHELPMMAMTRALKEEKDACNAGFLRDDAILVVFHVSNDLPSGEPDDLSQESFGTPQSWYDAVVAAKKGIATNIVAVGLFDHVPTVCPHPSNGSGAAVKFGEFIKLFGNRGILAHICEPDYTPLLEQAVALIDTTCDEYIPPPE